MAGSSAMGSWMPAWGMDVVVGVGCSCGCQHEICACRFGLMMWAMKVTNDFAGVVKSEK